MGNPGLAEASGLRGACRAAHRIQFSGHRPSGQSPPDLAQTAAFDRQHRRVRAPVATQGSGSRSGPIGTGPAQIVRSVGRRSDRRSAGGVARCAQRMWNERTTGALPRITGGDSRACPARLASWACCSICDPHSGRFVAGCPAAPLGFLHGLEALEPAFHSSSAHVYFPSCVGVGNTASSTVMRRAYERHVGIHDPRVCLRVQRA